MAEPRKASEAKAVTANNWDAGQLLAANQHALEAWARAVSALTDEVSQFVQARLREDMSTWTKLAACKDPSQAFECNSQYFQKATTDYFGEAGKLSRLTMNVASDSFSAFRGESERENAAA